MLSFGSGPCAPGFRTKIALEELRGLLLVQTGFIGCQKVTGSGAVSGWDAVCREVQVGGSVAEVLVPALISSSPD